MLHKIMELQKKKNMRKTIFAFALLAMLAACNQSSKTTQPVETESEAAAAEEAADTIDAETRQENMQEVQAYLKECGVFYIATTDGDQPRVRPFGVSEIINGQLYIMTGKVKDVYKQMAANGKFEICALKPSGAEWLRLSGTLVADETLAVKEEFLERNPSLKAMYKADDDNMAVLYVTKATARFCSFTEAEKKVNF